MRFNATLRAALRPSTGCLTDSDGSSRLPRTSRPPSHVRRRTRIASARCKARDCFTQFAASPDSVLRVRQQLAALEAPMRDVHLQLMLHLGDPGGPPLAAGRGGDSFPDSDPDEHVQNDADSGFASSDPGAFSDSPVRVPAAASGSGNRRPYRTRANHGRAGVLDGKPVCMWALQKLLGVGSSTTELLRRGGQTRRPGSRKEPQHDQLQYSMLHKAWVKWPSVLWFFWMLYHSAAEGLPEGVIKMEQLQETVRGLA